MRTRITSLRTSRAETLLENDQRHSFLPYNFSKMSTVVCEGIDPRTAKEELEAITSRGQQVFDILQRGLFSEKKRYKEQFDVLTESYPLLQHSLEDDVSHVIQRASIVGSSVQLQNPHETTLKECYHELASLLQQEFSEEKKRRSFLSESLFTLRALRSLELPVTLAKRIRDVCVGFLGVAFIIAGSQAFYMTLSRYFDNATATTLTAIFFGVLVEEFYKVLTVRFFKSPLPAFTTFLLEFLAYTGSMISYDIGKGSIATLSGALLLIVGIIGRVYALEMHMKTTQYYTTDLSRFGKVRVKTFLTGVALHALWNTAVLFVHIFRVSRGFLTNEILGIAVETQAGVNIATLFNKIFGKNYRRQNAKAQSSSAVSSPPSLHPHQQRDDYDGGDQFSSLDQRNENNNYTHCNS